AEYSRRDCDADAGPLLATPTHPSVHGLRLRASTPARKPSPEVGALSNCVSASLRRDRRVVARASSSPRPPIRARCRDRTAPLRMRSADVICVLVRRGDNLGRSRFAHARLPREYHFLEAHDIIADRDHLAARRAHLFRSRRRRHERHVLLKRLLIAGTSVSFPLARSWYQR
ncbi:hypothetical protein DFH09DRAFT_1192990, partial [Mycena vulgaris]